MGQVPTATTACAEHPYQTHQVFTLVLHFQNLSISSLVNMGHHHNQLGHHYWYLAPDGHQNNPHGGEGINNVWLYPVQTYEHRKEGLKLTWSELVHVRTIEPCLGQERGRWHHPHHTQRQGSQWEGSNQTHLNDLPTSHINDL